MGASRLRRLSPRRELLLALLLGLAGAGLVLLAVRQGWAHVRTAAPRPLPGSNVALTGQDLVPAAGALAIAALASLAAVLATRGLVRRVVGLLLAAFGIGIAAAVSAGITAADAIAAAAGNAGVGRQRRIGRHRGLSHRGLSRGRRRAGRRTAHCRVPGACGHDQPPVARADARRRGGRCRGRAAGRVAGGELAGHVQPLRPARAGQAASGRARGAPGTGRRRHRHHLGVAQPRRGSDRRQAGGAAGRGWVGTWGAAPRRAAAGGAAGRGSGSWGSGSLGTGAG